MAVSPLGWRGQRERRGNDIRKALGMLMTPALGTAQRCSIWRRSVYLRDLRSSGYAVRPAEDGGRGGLDGVRTRTTGERDRRR